MTAACVDWRQAPAAEAIELVAREAAVWRATLDWDVSESWRVLEPARAAGTLPGLVADGPGGHGWTCFLQHRSTLQVAMLVADSVSATEALLAGILQSPEAADSTTHVICVRDAAPGLRALLEARGFSVETYRYLSAPIAPGAPSCRTWVAWQSGHLVSTAELFARAYPSVTETRAFAPHGTPAEWLEYVMTLVGGSGCGSLLPVASGVVPAVHAGAVDAAILTTALGPRTAHVAQIAVDPGARRRGIARELVESACALAAGDGREQMTLMVAAANAAAGRLYEQLGFRERATFVVAVNRQPTRSSSVAFASGGASTRR